MPPSAVTHHHGSPIWTCGSSPNSPEIPASSAATLARNPIASDYAGEISAEGGSHPVNPGEPSYARCFHASGQNMSKIS
jgi:hypothetical protein